MAAAALAGFEVIVFGDGLFDDSHPDHDNMVTLIAQLRTANSDVEILGYVDLGVSTQVGITHMLKSSFLMGQFFACIFTTNIQCSKVCYVLFHICAFIAETEDQSPSRIYPLP